MFSLSCFWDWIHQVIHIILFKFLSCYHYRTTFIFTPFHVPTTTTDHPVIPDEIMTDILLRLPIKTLSKFMCVSKSWNQLIYSPYFVNTHMKLNSHHRVLFRGRNGDFKFCSLLPLFNRQQTVEELIDVDSPTLEEFIVGSANGLICLVNLKFEAYIWNPTISKSKKLLKSTWGSFSTKYGFGYDELHDDYKAVFVDYYFPSFHNVVNIYSLRTDSWTTLDDQLQGIYLVNNSGIFVNGKLYWLSSSTLTYYIVCRIISFDLADETWGSMELPIYGEATHHFRLGVVGSDLSLLHACQSNNEDLLFFLHSVIMMCDGLSRQLEQHIDDVEGYSPLEVYEESLINPLTISGQGPRIRETSQSLS
ncbi:F-box/kelch-repeat protein At3g23880 isoform X1 [Capsicum annuum]|uniref:F-box/kelch-repeat protein At3g23880 isoform X1 n=1 Tax=Capsicum annuum TaxID=4072 RepID=UPI001FB1819E|nr:F-box/kelch-repeat protein At3g23880 isoform X1 [Capsicum annuum]